MAHCGDTFLYGVLLYMLTRLEGWQHRSSALRAVKVDSVRSDSGYFCDLVEILLE
jgi:hypothetical protein